VETRSELVDRSWEHSPAESPTGFRVLCMSLFTTAKYTSSRTGWYLTGIFPYRSHEYWTSVCGTAASAAPEGKVGAFSDHENSRPVANPEPLSKFDIASKR